MFFKFFRGKITLAGDNRDNIVWKSATGRCTPLRWMTNNHILNTLNCLRGTGLTEIPEIYEGKSKLEWIRIFEFELLVRCVENDD